LLREAMVSKEKGLGEPGSQPDDAAELPKGAFFTYPTPALQRRATPEPERAGSSCPAPLGPPLAGYSCLGMLN
jgi:hypothetical protein